MKDSPFVARLAWNAPPRAAKWAARDWGENSRLSRVTRVREEYDESLCISFEIRGRDRSRSLVCGLHQQQGRGDRVQRQHDPKSGSVDRAGKGGQRQVAR